ncbi:MAG: hypothetical protein B1H11_00860 [Desulfobacteraceae bacterium 4484_190.1]|nr:MAG: hypothetical protein B1H11_00860 [Desulfobacteraceae bacterium 4484_190.1]
MEFQLGEIARIVKGTIVGDDSIIINGINSLDAAGMGDIAFFAGRQYKEQLKNTKASAVIISEKTDLFDGPLVLTENPALAFAKVSGLFAPPVPRYNGISDQAVVHESSRLGKGVSIYPMVYIGKDAVIGDETILFPGTFIGERVVIGKRTVIYPNVVIMQDCIIGNDVIIHAGTVIGSDGFGFVRNDSTSVKIPQVGIVQIDDDVEIGADSCIDRAAMGKTWIKRGVKTDNLVQVAHNVVIGEDTIIVAQVGISGSVNIGRQVIIGGQAGISDHLDIGDKAMIGAQSGIAKAVAPGEVVSGTPALPHRLTLRTSKLIALLPKLNERIRNIEKNLRELEKKIEDNC